MSDSARIAGRGRGSFFLLATAALGLGSCAAVGPNFERPPAPSAGTYLPPEPRQKGEDGPEVTAQRVRLGEAISGRWWGLFHSKRLDDTLHQALKASPSLAAARATLLEAEEGITIARGGLYPELDLLASAHRGTGATGSVSNLLSVGPSLSFSIDAFGETKRRVEEATALRESQRYELAAAYLSVTGNAVTQAIAIATARAELATVEDVIRNDERDQELVEHAFEAGKVAKSDVLTAAAQLASDQTQLPPLRQALSVARHALAVLSGRATGEWAPPDVELDEFVLPSEVPVSLPSELVHGRPDILSAEALLHADSAAIGVATAEMYPSITLSASLTQSATTLAGLVTSALTSWEAGLGADAPLFRGGALAAGRRAAIDAYQAGLATYNETVFQAFGQVADVLSALDHDAEAVAASVRAVEVAGDSLALQRSSYAAGKSTALQLIAAENTYSMARLGAVHAAGQRLSDTALLLVATGGGWQNEGDLSAPQKDP